MSLCSRFKKSSHLPIVVSLLYGDDEQSKPSKPH